MKKVTLYSRSGRARMGSAPPAPPGRPRSTRPVPPNAATADEALPSASPPAPATWRTRLARYERPLLLAAGALFAIILVAVHASFAPVQPQVTQKDIDAAVLYTLENVPMQSHAAK